MLTNSVKLAMILASLYPAAVYGEERPPGVGVSGGTYQRSLTLGDFNLFQPGVVRYGFPRYGGAMMYLFGGDGGIGINIMGHPGFIITAQPVVGGLSIIIGAEPGAGAIRATTSGMAESFYEWTPAGSVGVATNVFGIRGIAVVRGGVGVGSLNSTGGLTPYSNLLNGYAVYVGAGNYQFGHHVTNVGANSIRSFDLYNNDKLGVRYESINGRQQETNVMGLLRWQLR